MSLSDLISRG